MNCKSGCMCRFVEGNQRHNKNPPQFRPIASKYNMTVLQHLPRFLDLELFINVGLGLVLKYV